MKPLGPSIKDVRIKEVGWGEGGEGRQPNADSCGQGEMGVDEMKMSAL